MNLLSQKWLGRFLFLTEFSYLSKKIRHEDVSPARGYCQLKSNWADFLPRAGNLKAEQSMSDEFVYGLMVGRIHFT